MNSTQKQMLILIAGPYRSGTGDDPVLIRKNLDDMTEMALKVYEKGHMPLIGEWFTLPMIEAAGSAKTGDEIFNRYFHPVSVQLVGFCDAVLRIGGPSAGADEMVQTGLRNGKKIFMSLAEIPELG